MQIKSGQFRLLSTLLFLQSYFAFLTFYDHEMSMSTKRGWNKNPLSF